MVIEGGSGEPSRTGDGARPRRGKPGRTARLEQPQTVIHLPKDPYENDPKAPRARRGRGVLALAAVVVVIAAVIAINSTRKNNTATSQGASTGVGGGVPPATATTAPGQSVPTGQNASPAFPSGEAKGVAIGYADTKDGAMAAATNYIAAYVSEPMVHSDQRHAMIHQIADPAIEPQLQSELDTAFATAARGYGLDTSGNPPAGQTLVYRGVPAGVQVQSYTNDKAVVSVWTCTIDGIAGQGSTNPVTSTWSTLTVTLTWVNNDWRWNDFAQADGPTPVEGTQQASSSADLQKAVRQFARLRYAP